MKSKKDIKSVVLLMFLVSVACFLLWSCGTEKVMDPSEEMKLDEILEEILNANTQAELDIAIERLLDQTVVRAPVKGDTGGPSECIKDCVDEYQKAKKELDEQYKGKISKEEYKQRKKEVNDAFRERVKYCLEFSKGYKDIIFPEIRLAELIPAQVIFGELDTSGHQHLIDLMNQAAEEEGQIPDELEAILETIEDKLTQVQIDSLIDLDFDELLQFIEETGDVPAWLDEIFEVFQEEPTLNFLIPTVSPPEVIPPEITPPEIIWPEGNPKAPSSLFLQSELAAPSAEYDTCVQAAQSTYNSAVIDIDNDYNTTITQINQQHDNLISMINNAHATCTEAANQMHNVRLAEIGVLSAACLLAWWWCPLCGAAVCAAAAAIDIANSANLLSQDILACNDAKTQNEQTANNIKAQNIQAANNAKAQALLDAQAQLQADIAACHDQGGTP